MRSTSPRSTSKAARLLSAVLLLTSALFGLMSLNQLWSMLHHELSWSNQLLIWAISSDFLLGDPTLIEQTTRNYTRGFGGISTHTFLGGLALASCSLQFIPSLRRRSPKLHRAVGAVAGVSTAASMLGALAYLMRTPASDVISGEFFVGGLWVLAVSTLAALGMALLSIRQRQIREHMAWMALLMACLMNAPLLRLGYVLMGNLIDMRIGPINAGMSAVVMSLSVLLMSWWLQRIGRHDVGLMPAHPGFAPTQLRGMAAAAILTVLHEGVLAPLGLDALGHWRSHGQTLPWLACVWAVAVAALLTRIPDEMPAIMRGEPFGKSTLCLAALAGMAAALVAWHMPLSTPNDVVRCFVFGNMSLLSLGTAIGGLIWREHGNAMQRWRLLSLYLWLTPASWLPLGLLACLTGWSFDGVWAVALGLSAGSGAWNGYAAAFGLRMPGMMGMPATQASVQSTPH